MVNPSIWMGHDERYYPTPETVMQKVEERRLQATLAKLSKYYEVFCGSIEICFFSGNPRTRKELTRQLMIMRKMINLRHHIPMINSVLQLLTKIQRNSNTLESKIRF